MSESKMGDAAAILVKSLEYKKDMPKFVEYVRSNREYFPFLSDKNLEELINIKSNTVKDNNNKKTK